jgi:hypothetical protein
MFQRVVFFLSLLIADKIIALNANKHVRKEAIIHNLLENVNKNVQKNFCIR